jgi:aspartate-semialdehyde dehydrogenase
MGWSSSAALGRVYFARKVFPLGYQETLSVFDSIAIVGATGAVGGLIRSMLEERSFPYERIKFLASARSAGSTIEFAGEKHTVEELRPEAFEGIDLAIGSTPDPVAKDFVPWAVERGCVVVDESGYWRMDPKVPLVIPEVNPDDVHNHQGIIASPNCSTTQMVVAMKPIYDASRIRRVVVSTYQATSGAGVGGQRDLEAGSRAALENKDYKYTTFAHPIAFNLIPQIGSPKHKGYTSEEMKMVYETHKILGDDEIRICPTCVRVPVSNCHSESILLETERKITVEEARDLFAAFPGIKVIDDLPNGKYPKPSDCDGDDAVFIGRIREDLSCENGLAFWCVSDNLRKGAATNAVQIAELLVSKQPATV